MEKILLLTTEQVLEMNKKISAAVKQQSVCFDNGKIESALSAAYYPGIYSFQYGGVASVAGAMCYFLTKSHAFMDGNKRTAGIAATVFMQINRYKLNYPIQLDMGLNAYAEIIDQTTASQVSKDQLIAWFETHKEPLN